MLAEPATEAEERILERLRTDTPYYAEHCLTIVGKDKRKVKLLAKPGQLALDALLEEQRAAGKPQRAIVLKARQTGMSTWVQGKLIQAATQIENLNALVVAHDRDTGGKLYQIGERMYSHLPEDVKPDIRAHGRTRFLHFGDRGADAWQTGEIWPDSTYFVDTAGEFQAGRGATYHKAHLSEFAFWGQALTKYTGLMQTVPDDPESLIVIESTANGHNLFKDLWDDAENGRSDYAAFFWPWWKENEYRLPFQNEAEREAFKIGDHELWGEAEPELVENFKLDLEQLHWRRWAIPNKCAGKLEVFQQEYPSSAEEAFLSTGARVFDAMTVRSVLIDVEAKFDPRIPTPEQPGPVIGLIRSLDTVQRAGLRGRVEVPTKPEFVPRERLGMFETADWRCWLPIEKGELQIPDDRSYVVAADVSGGLPESEEGDPAYHALQVIDHETKEQVAEYRSRIDPDLFADHAYLTALLFNEAYLAIEITGGWGGAVVRRVWNDYRYRFTYQRKRVEGREDRAQDRMGWDTNRSTKPILLAGGQELLREGSHGIHSRRLLREMLTYVKHPNGQTGPENNRFADLLMAWLIAQQVALMMPPRRIKKGPRRKRSGYHARDPVAGY
jgi:hypothetical protein